MPTKTERDILAELLERLEKPSDGDGDSGGGAGISDSKDDALKRLMQALQADGPPDGTLPTPEKPKGGGDGGDSGGGAEASIDRGDDRPEIEPLSVRPQDDTQPTPDPFVALLVALHSPPPTAGATRVRRPGELPSPGGNRALDRLMEALGEPVEQAPAPQPPIQRYRGPSL